MKVGAGNGLFRCEERSNLHLLSIFAIYILARQSYFADEDPGEQKNENDFLHTENVMLVDKKRRIRGVYKGTDATEINNLINDIKLLEQEPQ